MQFLQAPDNPRLASIYSVYPVVTAEESGWRQRLTAVDAVLHRVPALQSALWLEKLTARQGQILDALAIESRGHAIARAREAGLGA